MTTNPPSNSAGKSPRWRSRVALLLAAGAAVTGMATAFPVLTANAAPAPARAAAAAQKATLNLAGAYTVYFSWGCTAHYTQGGFNFNANGTFTDPFGGAGTWALVNGTLMAEYNAPSRTAYVGTIDGSAGSGASSTLTGVGEARGCWFMTAPGTTFSPRIRAHHGHTADPQIRG